MIIQVFICFLQVKQDVEKEKTNTSPISEFSHCGLFISVVNRGWQIGEVSFILVKCVELFLENILFSKPFFLKNIFFEIFLNFFLLKIFFQKFFLNYFDFFSKINFWKYFFDFF